MEDQSFGEWLRRQLLLRDWSSADFARRIPTGNNTVAQWIHGKRIPSPESCRRIADALSVSDELVLTVAGHYEPPDPVDPDSLEAMITGLVRQVAWDEENAAIVGGILRSYIDMDRRAKERRR